MEAFIAMVAFYAVSSSRDRLRTVTTRVQWHRQLDKREEDSSRVRVVNGNVSLKCIKKARN